MLAFQSAQYTENLQDKTIRVTSSKFFCFKFGMKIRRKLLFIFLFVFILSLSVFCQESRPSKRFWISFDTVTDFSINSDSESVDFSTLHNESEILSQTHFSPATGYGGMGLRGRGNLSANIWTPLGGTFLLDSSKVSLTMSMEVTPITMAPGLSVSFTPFPFLILEAGYQAGTGSKLGESLLGLGRLDQNLMEYVELDFMNFWRHKFFVKTVLQFDLGAVIKSLWTHVLFQYTYQCFYECMSGMKNQDLWMYQGTGNKVNGWQDYQCLIFAYQLPFVLNRAGIMVEVEGHYNSDDYANPLYKGDFHTVSISPLLQFKFGKKDTLATVVTFSSRRGYTTSHTYLYEEPFLTYAGREWFFYRAALSWTHTFS